MHASHVEQVPIHLCVLVRGADTGHYHPLELQRLG